LYFLSCLNNFLKCPFNKKFACGTVDTGLFDPNDYEYYLPNYNAAITSDMEEQQHDDDIDYFHSNKYDF
jgi:hypothetical protein